MSVLNSDPVLDLGEAARSMRPPLRSCLSTPVIVADTLFGVLTAYSTQRDAFSENHLRIFEAVASQIGSTLRDSLLAESKRDSRAQNHFSATLEVENVEDLDTDEWNAHALLSGFAIVQIDVDVNNRGSLPTTESMMSLFLNGVRAELRSGDRLLRVGGTGLVALLPNGDSDAAFGIASRVKERLSGIAARNGVSAKITVGVAAAPDDGTALAGLIEKARRRAVDAARDRRGSVH